MPTRHVIDMHVYILGIWVSSIYPELHLTLWPFQQAEQHAEEPSQFDFERQWYPLAFVEDLDPGRPHAAELLGKRLVLWRDASQQWRAFEDRCPHRLAPLSGEGRPSYGSR